MNIKSRMKYDKNSRYTGISFCSSSNKNIIILSFMMAFKLFEPKNIHLFTRFHTGAAITPFCTLVTVITSSVAPSAL